MMHAGNFFTRYSKILLERKQQAFWCAVIFSVIPFASWLSVALVVLVTLRKGARQGFEIMLPALLTHLLPLMVLLPLKSALINALLAYLPCYLAALSLRHTGRWSAVFSSFFIQALLGFLSIQLLAPDFVMDQFYHFKKLMIEYPEYQHFIEASSYDLLANSGFLAQLFFGVQILGLVITGLISLLFARSIQSKLFMPGGFRSELLAFRSGRLSFLILLGVSIASYYEILLAINLLPLVLCNFLISGFSLGFHLVHFIRGRKNQVKVLVLFFVCLVLKPYLILLTYIIFGSLDSLFNFRLYLPVRAKKST